MPHTLSIGSWTRQLCELKADIAVSQPSSAPAILTGVRALLAQAPEDTVCLGPLATSPKRFRALLDQDGFESAAVALLDAKVGYMISRGPNGACLASVVLPGMGKDISAGGESVALALVSAYLDAILHICRPS